MDKLKRAQVDFIEGRFLELEPRALSIPGKSVLCELCRNVAADPRRQPWHVVHPITSELLVYNARGEAVCPDCGARWHHVGNLIRLAEDSR